MYWLIPTHNYFLINIVITSQLHTAMLYKQSAHSDRQNPFYSIQ